MTEGVFLADNLDVLRGLPDSCLDLVYIDPPFGTNQVRRLDAIKTGRAKRRATVSGAGITPSK